MAREKLKSGQLLELCGKDKNIKETFQILDLIGEGSLCLVYDVLCPNGMTGRLKEFYPASEGVGEMLFVREGAVLTRNPSSREGEAEQKLRTRFLRGYAHMRDIHVRDPKSRNEMPNYGELYTAGASIYWFMSYDEGLCYSNVGEETLAELCAVGLAVVRAVDRYHRLGYLHLDIKEENIFILPQTRDYIKFIDFDNIVSKEEIRGGAVYGYSEKTAAPEVQRGRRDLIREASDYYSVGAMIYRRLCRKEVTAMERVSMARFFLEEYLEEYGDVKEELGELLGQFFKRTLSNHPAHRYRSASEMEEQLQRIIERALPVETELAKAAIQKNLFCLFHRFPIYRYMGEGDTVSVLIDGEGEIADAAFRAVFGCCGQMLDKRLHIYLTCENPEYRKREKKKEMPALEKMAVLDRNNETGKYGLLYSPLAEVDFLTWRRFLEKEEEGLGDPVRYYLLADRNMERNRMRVGELADRLASGREEQVFIGCCAEKNEERREGNAVLCSFGRSRSQVDEEFYIKLIKQAFLIDQAYEGIPSGKDSARFDSFCRNIYRYQSSIENAMHLDCKLFYCGLHEENEARAADLFEKRVLDGGEDTPLYRELLFLEHRRWMASMAARGWDAYDRFGLERIKYGRQTGYKDAGRKRHPCMVDCERGDGCVLRGIPGEQWSEEMEKIRKEDTELDHLDQVSVWLHARAGVLCQNKEQVMRHRVSEIEAGFAMQGDEMPESWIRVKRLLAHIREERGPFSGEWKQVMEDARRDIEEQQDEEMCRYFADLYEGVSVYQEYRHFHDYKETDGVLIAHIPEILRGF